MNDLMHWTPEEFLAFCDELAKRGTLTSVCAGGYAVYFAAPDTNKPLAETLERVATMVVRSNGKHVVPLP